LCTNCTPGSNFRSQAREFHKCKGIFERRYLSLSWSCTYLTQIVSQPQKHKLSIFLHHWICSTYFWYSIYYSFTLNNWSGICFYKTSGNMFSMKHKLQMYCYCTCAGNTQKVSHFCMIGGHDKFTSLYGDIRFMWDGHQILRKKLKVGEFCSLIFLHMK
jgi:hypothetical protein